MKAIWLAAAPLAVAGALGACATLSPGPTGMTIETVGNRADLVSGGDVLVRVTLPEGASAEDAALTVNGQPFRDLASFRSSDHMPASVSSDALHPAPDGKGWLAQVM